VAVTKEQVNQLYGQLLGRSGQDQYLEGWVNSGMTLDQIRAGIAGSPEGVAYANRPAEPPPPPPPPPEPVATISRAEVDALYQDVFGRNAQDAGAQYWISQVESGAIAPENLRDALIAGAQGSDVTAYSERGTRLQQQAAEQARLAAEEQYRQQQEAAEARAQRQMEQQRALAEQARLDQQAQLDMLRQQQERQQQFFQNLASAGIQGKGGVQQQQQQDQSVFGDAGPQPTQTAQESQMLVADDIDSGGGYYRNPYASGYGMGYQDPYAGMRYMPQRGLMGPSGFGGKGGYSQPMYPSYGYSPYSGMSPSKGGYGSAREAASMPPEGYTQTIPNLPEAVATPDVFPTTAGETTMIEDAVMATPSQAATTAVAPMPSQMYPLMYPQMYPMRPMYPMYGGKGGYYR